MSEVDQHRVPRISAGLLGWFRWFVNRYLKRHFHSIAVNRQQLRAVAIDPTDALVVYANHAAWWDPLTAIHLAHQLFPGFDMYAPIDSQALAKYPMFARMGFFAVEQHSLIGASEFLKKSLAIVGRPAASLWLTPEGRFADVRDGSAALTPGLSHVAWKLARKEKVGSGGTSGGTSGRVWFVPVAVEYPFWEERRPELLVWFGQPACTREFVDLTKSQCARELTARLRQAQQQLAEASIARRGELFEVLGSGQSGTFFIYDWWRQWRGWLGGRRVRVDHGDKLR